MSVLIALLLAASGPDASAQAREHFKSGQTHYALGEFEQAIQEFRETYRLRQEPALLFNIGQAYRQLHDWQQAYFNYRQYLNLKTDASNRAEVESLIAQMQYQLDLEKEQKTRIARDPAAARAPESVLPSAHPEQPAPMPPLSSSSGLGFRSAGYAALASGALAEGAAFFLHGSAQSAADQFNQKYAAGQLTAQDTQLKSSAESKGKLAGAALIGGAALLVTGAVLCFAF